MTFLFLLNKVSMFGLT